jgi:hypothetical protein
LIQPKYSHKIHKLQHRFDTMNHTSHHNIITRTQESPFQISPDPKLIAHE